ncbi:regulator of V-ATPase in vacuolar membrane protein 1 [Trichinella spiralis]|uniref:regulator of V-ATPase in vacuolar membrane protein 1 n=1 Tax=Trichinella spiralis TaxID=6334 RepID=UPI0001EFEFA4|nr:regulator of V-ATPase in vacuolar membrane protein 1 [Trichinella spiralis]
MLRSTGGRRRIGRRPSSTNPGFPPPSLGLESYPDHSVVVHHRRRHHWPERFCPCIGSNCGSTYPNLHWTKKCNRRWIRPTQRGPEAVDECGLRYLMSVRHFEYLLRCLPLPQRAALRANGLPSANLIWALHSESENELFNSLSCVQRNEANWSDLRSLGVGWWLKSLQSLRLCFEKIAKAAFQAKNDPMDAALFYLAMKKKNVLMHLFKTVRDVKMTEFLSHDFTDAKWKKAALKNAFVLMSKQRFEHAVGWFLLGDSLNDAVKVCLANMNDLQLALVIIRLYEGDSDLARRLIRKVLCEQVLQCEEEVFEKTNDQTRSMDSVFSSVYVDGLDLIPHSIVLWMADDPSFRLMRLCTPSHKYDTLLTRVSLRHLKFNCVLVCLLQ